MDPEFEFKIRRARSETPEQRIADSLELCDLLGDMAAAGLRARRPNATDAEITRILVERAIESQARSYRR